jgi:DNA-3-methyladenine glycosylase II
VSGDTDRAYRSLRRIDPVFGQLIAAYGHPEPFAWRDPRRTGRSKFAAMVLHIVGQQISNTVAFAIYDRLMAAAGGVPTPAAILALDHATLRAVGLSEAKSSYVRALADAQSSGAIDIEHLDGVADDDIVKQLTAIRGIGTWSAEMFLVFNLHRADVLPSGDLGIRTAVQRQWRLDELPLPKDVKARGEPWSPWRTYAATLLWSSLGPPTPAAGSSG